MPRTEFLEHYLNNEPILVQNIAALEKLSSLPFLSSLESLFNNWPTSVNTYLEGTADEVNSGEVDIDKAKNLFDVEKRGLFFDDPNRFSETIDHCLQQLRIDLGLSNLTYARSLIYLIAKGKGTATHFDQNINFVLQISGTKKWWIAANSHVINPTTRHTLGHPIDPELSSYSPEKFPEEIPQNAKEYILEPGSLLFLPRGAWHKTEALSDALSLNFTYSAPTWIDLLTATLRGHLIQSEQWRETANFVNDKDLRPHALGKLDQMMEGLVKNMQHLSAEDIFSTTEGDDLLH